MFLEPERDQPTVSYREKLRHFPFRNAFRCFLSRTSCCFPRRIFRFHIFEPRYRQMVADAAAGGQCIGMALLKEGWEGAIRRQSAYFSMGCVGRLASVQALPDGRSNILLQGLERYEVHEEFYERSYREARVSFKPRDRGLCRLDPPLRVRYWIGCPR